MTRKLAAIIAADVVGYSRLMGADEAGTLAALKTHRRELIDPKVAEHQGRIVKTTGDGLLIEFPSVVEAVQCAVEVQRAMRDRNTDVPADHRIELRVGINLGDIIIDGEDIYGDGVNVAARLEGLAEPNGICVSRVVRDQVRDKLDVAFEDLGEQQVKNIARPVRIFRITAPTAAPPRASAKPTLALPDKPSIAVLPFANLSGDPEQEYFADGIVEDIITALSRFKELFVIARNSSFVYKGMAVDIQRVARELGVRYVLEGSVRKAGNRVRITGQLINAATRAHLWADKFDGAFEDVFELQDRVTESVVGALVPSLQRAELERARLKAPANFDAYDYVLRAIPHQMANSPAEAGKAIRLLMEAIRLDPDYGYAHALLASAYAQVFRDSTGQERAEARRRAEEHARKALAVGNDDSAVLTHAGWILLLVVPDVAGARAALDMAAKLNPNSAIAHAYRSIALALTGEPHAAIEDATKALRLSPVDPSSYLAFAGIAVARIALNEFDEAAAAGRKVIEMNPRFPMAYAWAIVAECGRGDKAQAEFRLNQLTQIIPNFKAAGLPALFGYFPSAIREQALGLMRSQGLIP